MALIVDPQSSFKHFCKICKKGFGCGSALGGHMRAHGIGDEAGQMDYEDQGSPTNKRMYALRTNPNRLKSCRVCENCGEKFLSWKSFLEHGKCNSEDEESLVSSPGSDDEDASAMRGCGWSKRKRLQRVNLGNFISNCPSSEEEDLANCLMMLSNGTVDSLVSEPEESCASASKDADRIRYNPINYPRIPSAKKAKGGVAGEGVFECKACKKVFSSHQALGGHRASHKKVKGCFAARLDEDTTTHEELSLNNRAGSNFQIKNGSLNDTHSKKKKSKVHECSICHRVFSTGQALGGHKRCHWITSNSPDPSTSMAMATKLHHFQDHLEQIQHRPKLLDLTLDLNLNLPAQTELDAQTDQEDKNNNKDNNSKSPSNRINNVEDEADSIVKLAKLSDLKELNMKEGSSSPWLQVGIGSTTGVGADP